jgi:hypothetical protein
MANIGSTLREARMRAGIDITEVESRTKIRAKYLRAIENEEWDLLPGPVYVKSFLRTYGDFLGLDSRALIDEYKQRYERPADHDMRPISSLHRERERAARGPLIPAWGLIGLVLLAVVAALFVLGGGFGGASNSTPTTGSQPLTANRHPTTRRHRSGTRARPLPVKLVLVPTGPVYVCLVNGAGKKLIYERTFDPGQRIPTERGGKLLLTLGNASVHMTVDGRPVPVAPSSSAIRLLIDRAGVHSIPLSMPPTCP